MSTNDKHRQGGLTRQLAAAAAGAGTAAPTLTKEQELAEELAQVKQTLLFTQQSLVKVCAQRNSVLDQLADNQAALDRANAANRQLRSVKQTAAPTAQAQQAQAPAAPTGEGGAPPAETAH